MARMRLTQQWWRRSVSGRDSGCVHPASGFLSCKIRACVWAPGALTVGQMETLRGQEPHLSVRSPAP